jgi:hypothetical protein
MERRRSAAIGPAPETTMTESIRKTIARLVETAGDEGWIEIETEGDGAHLVGGELALDAESVTFEDDSGLRRAIRYRAVTAIRLGRQGDADFSLHAIAPEDTAPREPADAGLDLAA